MSVCPWCGGSVDTSIPDDKGGPLCISGWSACAGKVPFRIMLESVREAERREANQDRRRAIDERLAARHKARARGKA